MFIRTKSKILLARIAQAGIVFGRRIAGLGPTVDCRRADANWRLDLNEGIDFSIFLLGSFEQSAMAVYRRLIKNGDVVIDIGANIGSHTLPLAVRVGDAGRVVAIEPTAWAFEKLTLQLSLNPDLSARVTPLQAMLLADSKSSVPEAIPSSWPLATPAEAHSEHGGVAKSTRGARAITLDELVAELGLARVDFVKLDVDGFELEVLRGAKQTLATFAPTILFEHAPYTLVEKGYEPDEMTRLLLDAGYRFRDLSGAMFDGDGRRLPDVLAGAGINIIASRTPAAESQRA